MSKLINLSITFSVLVLLFIPIAWLVDSVGTDFGDSSAQDCVVADYEYISE